MHNDAAGMAISVQAKANKLGLARAPQGAAGRSIETNNSTRASGSELKAPLQRTGLDLNNLGLKTQLSQQGL